MVELQTAVDSYPFWKAVLWCFYPISMLILIEFITNNINDDDDDDGGKMVPILQSN
tara:strand:- start:1414 stop:1581 length:168 start_codon:yes stop_codon:yes gene_type:complete